jgi:hypothetical protein
MQGWMDAAMAVGGAVSLFNTVKGVMTVNKGIGLIKNGGMPAEIAAHQGVELNQLTGLRQLAAYVPGTTANNVVTGVTQYDSLVQNVAKLEAGSMPRVLGDKMIKAWETGDATVGKPTGIGNIMFGLGDRSRGSVPMIGHRNAPMVELAFKDGRTAFTLNPVAEGAAATPLMVGKSIHLLNDSEMSGLVKEFAADVAAKGMNVNDVLAQAAKVGKSQVDVLENWVAGNTARQLVDAGAITNRFGNPLLNQAYAFLRPGALEDSLSAAASPIFSPSTASSIMSNPWFKRLLIGAGVGGGYYFFFKKPQDDAAKAAAEQGADAQAADGTTAPVAGQDAGTAGAGTVPPEVQQMLAQFSAMTPDQQANFIQTNTTQLQQAAQDPNLTAEQQAQIEQGFQVLQFLVAAVNSGGGPSGAGSAGAGSAVAGQQALGAQPAATGDPLVPQLPAGVGAAA